MLHIYAYSNLDQANIEGAPLIPDPTPRFPVPDARILAAAGLLRQLANDRRLLVLCHLAVEGEMTVGRLAERVGLSQPALSQHLTRMRGEGLVATRRAGTQIHYRIADPRVARLLDLLHGMFCPDDPA